MKLFLSTVLILLLAIASSSFAQKLLIVGGETFDWGKVKPKDMPLNTIIKLKNVGTDTLFIKEAKPGCGCTTPTLKKQNLAPGEETNLEIGLNLPSYTGPVTKVITITSNDNEQSARLLYLKCDVVRDFVVSPTQYFTFNDMVVNKEASAKVTLKNASATDMVLTDWNITGDLVINLKGNVTLKAGQEIDLVARAIPKAKGYFNCSVKFKTNNPDFPTQEVTGYGQVIESNNPLFNTGAQGK